MKNKNRIDKNYLYLCVFLIIAISIPNMLVCMSTLGNGKDEIGTLASGAFFSGYNWNDFMVDNKVQFYGFGNTLLLSPIFRMFNNAYVLYGALRFVNTILIVLSACISYYILKNILKADSKKALFIACASASFMEVLKNAGAIVNESSLFLWCWIVLLCILLLARNVIEERGSLKHKIISGIFGVILA